MKTCREIAVLGAGHGGCAAAADLTRRGFGVRLHARREERLEPLRESGGIAVRGVQEGLVPIQLMTTDVAEAVEGADVIMLVVPSVAFEYYAERLAPLLTPERAVFLNPGHTGGGLHFVHELRRAGYREPVRTCESVTLTYICRIEGPASVGIYSYTRNLKFSAFPGVHAKELFDLMKPVYPELTLATSVLETGLANMNAVFHPPGMLMNAGWIEHSHGDFLFYHQGITEAVGQVVADVDAERMAVAAALGVPALPFLEAFYRAGLTTAAARDSGSIARACRESGPNATIKSPASLRHRYLHEDVGHGLVPMSELARVAGVPTPTIDSLCQLASRAVGVDYATAGLTLEKMGLEGLRPSAFSRFVREGDVDES